MKIYAQHGYGPKDKLELGLEQEILGGVVFSPRYWKPERMKAEIAKYLELGGDLFMDPEYYATGFISHPEPNLGNLEEWDYFESTRKANLITGASIPDILGSSFDQQIEMGLTQLIAPNVYIDQANSVETAIAVNFLNRAKEVASQKGDYGVYGTLAMHRDALLDGRDFRETLDGLTGLPSPPDGYYLVVGSNEQFSSGRFIRSDLSQAEVIAGWMYANYVLSLNGFEVVNGYCFLLSTLLGACGASAAASGWSSGLRKFCQMKYIKSPPGGSAPNLRYVSNALMSHILQTDLVQFSALEPDVLNGLPLDRDYLEGEPSRTEEALQAWGALQAQANETSEEDGDVSSQLAAFSERIGTAVDLWERLRARGLGNEIEPNLERLRAMDRGISLFREWAELPE